MRKGCALFSSFAGGVFLALCLLPEKLWLWLGLGFLALAVLAFWRKWRLLALVSLGLCLGLSWSGGYRQVRVLPWQELSGRRTTVSMVLTQTPEPVEDYAARSEVYLTREGKVPVKALFYGDLDLLDCHLGDRITAFCDVSMSDRLYDQTTAVYTSRGIFLRLTARGDLEISSPERTPFYLWPARWGERLSQSIQAVFPADVSPFLAALAAGDRSLLSDEANTDLSRAGVSHLVALSGMHLCFLVGFLGLFVGYDPKRRALVCLPVILAFSLAVGGSASVLRAAILYGILLLAPLLGREADRWTSLSFALALLLFLDPYGAQNMGLQLSFSAAAGLTLLADPLSRRWKERLPAGNTPFKRLALRGLRGLMNTFSATLGALVFTLPLSMLYFGSVSLIQPLTNLLVIPVSSALFALTLLLALVGMILPGPAAVCGGVVAWLGRYVLGVVSLAAKLPLSAVTTREIYYPIFILGLYGLLLLGVFGKGKRRLRVFLLSGVVLFAGAWGFTAATFHTGDLTVAVLDVGQGQSVLLTSGGVSALVDCGGNGLEDPGDVAADYLQDRGTAQLDYLILTHYHSDHVNGLQQLFRRVRVKNLILPQMEREEETQIWLLNQAQEQGSGVIWLTENTQFTLGEAVLSVFAPLGDGGANEEGLSLLASAGDFDLLITGDMNAAVEEMLIKYCPLPKNVEVLIAGHHGSRYASSDSLLEALHPSVAVISVGRNTYGHPAEETLERFSRRNITVYRTDRQGTITLSARRS